MFIKFVYFSFISFVEQFYIIDYCVAFMVG
jgi:hypothetical protein